MTRNLAQLRWFELAIEPHGWKAFGTAGVIALLIAAVGWLVYATGGTTYVWAHTIYVPILLAAMVFRVPGAIITAVVGGIVLGPWMPLDVAANTPQQAINWMYRIAVLSFIALGAGLLFATMHGQLARLRRLAFEDIETDLPNRLSLEDGARTAMAAATGDQRIYLLSVRVSNFLEIMTALGPTMARQVIQAVASELKSSVPNGSVYRLSQDSFAILLRGSSRRECFNTAERIAKVIERPHRVTEIPVHLDSHIGVAAYPFHESAEPDMLIRKSIQALQAAEQSGRRWCTYDRHQDEAQRRTLDLLGSLKPALDLGQLELHYQPKISLADGSLRGFEALIRWQHPQRGLLLAGEFVPAAEQSALIHPLTDWVIETALAQLHSWQAAGFKTRIAVNISSRNLADPGFADRVREFIEEYQPEPGSIEFELTEKSFFSDDGFVVGQMNEFRDLGVHLSIDDFGTGYSSLWYLQRLPVSTLKIDQSFIDGVADVDSASAKIVETSIALAANLGMETVAEGVEQAATLERLRAIGCSTFQGYLCAQPMAPAAATSWLERHHGGWQPLHHQ